MTLPRCCKSTAGKTDGLGLPGNAVWEVQSIPGLGKIPYGLQKNKNIKLETMLTANLNKDLKMVYIKKKILMDQQVEEERGGHPPAPTPLLPGLSQAGRAISYTIWI